MSVRGPNRLSSPDTLLFRKQGKYGMSPVEGRLRLTRHNFAGRGRPGRRMQISYHTRNANICVLGAAVRWRLKHPEASIIYIGPIKWSCRIPGTSVGYRIERFDISILVRYRTLWYRVPGIFDHSSKLKRSLSCGIEFLLETHLAKLRGTLGSPSCVPGTSTYSTLG